MKLMEKRRRHTQQQRKPSVTVRMVSQLLRETGVKVEEIDERSAVISGIGRSASQRWWQHKLSSRPMLRDGNEAGEEKTSPRPAVVEDQNHSTDSIAVSSPCRRVAKETKMMTEKGVDPAPSTNTSATVLRLLQLLLQTNAKGEEADEKGTPRRLTVVEDQRHGADENTLSSSDQSFTMAVKSVKEKGVATTGSDGGTAVDQDKCHGGVMEVHVFSGRKRCSGSEAGQKEKSRNNRR